MYTVLVDGVCCAQRSSLPEPGVQAAKWRWCREKPRHLMAESGRVSKELRPCLLTAWSSRSSSYADIVLLPPASSLPSSSLLTHTVSINLLCDDTSPSTQLISTTYSSPPPTPRTYPYPSPSPSPSPSPPSPTRVSASISLFLFCSRLPSRSQRVEKHVRCRIGQRRQGLP